MIDKLHADVLRQHKGISFVGVTTVFFCVDGKGEIFLARRSKLARDEHGRWDVGAGGLKWGQTAEANAIREIQEEYGAVPKSVTLLGYRDVFRELPDGTPTHWLAIDFRADVNKGSVEIKEPEMFDDSGWFRLDKLPAPLHSQLASAIEKYSSQLT